MSLNVVELVLMTPRLLKDVVTRRGNGKPVLSAHSRFLSREFAMGSEPCCRVEYASR